MSSYTSNASDSHTVLHPLCSRPAAHDAIFDYLCTKGLQLCWFWWCFLLIAPAEFLIPALEVAGEHTLPFKIGAKVCVFLVWHKSPLIWNGYWPSSSGLRGRRRTYHTILKLTDHALSKMVRYVLLWPLRPELARWPRSISNWWCLCQTRKTPTLDGRPSFSWSNLRKHHQNQHNCRPLICMPIASLRLGGRAP
jgi:hypothetical protein